VEDHRQIVTLRQPQLRFQQRLLTIKLRIVAIEIEANLPTATSFGGRCASKASSCASPSSVCSQ
jgi:hypothetical protein